MIWLLARHASSTRYRHRQEDDALHDFGRAPIANESVDPTHPIGYASPPHSRMRLTARSTSSGTCRRPSGHPPWSSRSTVIRADKRPRRHTSCQDTAQIGRVMIASGVRPLVVNRSGTALAPRRTPTTPNAARLMTLCRSGNGFPNAVSLYRDLDWTLVKARLALELAAAGGREAVPAWLSALNELVAPLRLAPISICSSHDQQQAGADGARQCLRRHIFQSVVESRPDAVAATAETLRRLQVALSRGTRHSSPARLRKAIGFCRWSRSRLRKHRDDIVPF
jgi:hypothetical protein